jgi:o-succinylbenzoate---CoA ligase
VTELVALDMPLGPALLDEIRRAHDCGRAVCVLDRRLSRARQRVILESLAPTMLVGEDHQEMRLAGGLPVEPGDGLVVLTSGTSGAPKAAILTWSAVIASAELTASELLCDVPTCWNAVLTPAHVGGFAVLTRVIFTDDQIVFGEPDRIDQGSTIGATHVALVRAHLFRFDVTGYRTVLLGGSRPPSHLPPNVVTTYGMTETGSGVVYNRRPLPGVHLAVRDQEVLVRSPTLLRTYRDGPAPLVAGPNGSGDWLATGDVGEIIDGELFIHGRLGHVIVTGGEKVWPEDLEMALSDVEGLADVAVAGVPDEEWGERLVALVVSSVDNEKLRSRCAEVAVERIGPWAKPRDLIYVAAIPRTDSGKVRRDELRRLVAATPRPGAS